MSNTEDKKGWSAEGFSIFDGQGRRVADFHKGVFTPGVSADGFAVKNVEDVVRCLNAHRGLIESLQNFLSLLDTPLGRRKYAGDSLMASIIEDAKKKLEALGVSYSPTTGWTSSGGQNG
jgi:hypothetical protein